MIYFFKVYIINNQATKALDLFKEIEKPDDVIYLLLCNACAQLKSEEALNLVKTISKDIPKSFYSNPRLRTSLLDVFIKCGDIQAAESFFTSSADKDVEMYGAMMSAFNKENNPRKTLGLFNELKSNGYEKNIIIWLCIIKALSKLGDYLLSQSIVEQISKDVLLDNQIQTALIDMWVSLKERFFFIFFSSEKRNVLFLG